MSKELPYFKFYVNEWITGTISLEDFSTQGLFIDLCSYYWSRKGDVSHKMLEKKYKNNIDSLDNLIDSGVVIIDEGLVKIDFLDEQMSEYEIVALRNSVNGKKGGRPPKTQEKPTPLISETKTEPNINLIRGEEIIVDKNIVNKIGTDSQNFKILIEFFNKTFHKDSRVMPKSVSDKYLARIKEGFSWKDITRAMLSASKDKYHIETNYKYCTLEFFSRGDKLDKFCSQSEEKKKPYNPNL